MKRMDHRVRRSKRAGKAVLAGVLMVSLVLGSFLFQALFLALEEGRGDLVLRAVLGIGFLVGLSLFSILLTRHQHRALDEALEEMRLMVEGDPSI